MTDWLVKISAIIFTLATLGLGYAAFGFWTTMIFTSGFLGGLVLWLIFPTKAPWSSIRVPYFLALILFIVHRIEEKTMNFFAALSDITGVQTPEILSWQVVSLVLISVGAWLLIPYLVKRGYGFGYYLAWTFFAAMGITELAHFIFPIIKGGSYGYFPGMASVVLLAPIAWWGMRKLLKQY
jgi:hypothetical protein